jgi:hypothetical protein
VGPISIEINARAHPNNRYPLYVEIAPSPASPCIDPGYVVMTARGGFDCDPWETIGPIDITGHIPLGSMYSVQVVFFHTADGSLESPGLDCIRVTAHPTSSTLRAATWGAVRRLYQ